MAMAEELADVQAAESDVVGVADAAIPDKSEAPERPLSVREALTKSVAEVREKEDRARDTTGKFTKKEAAEAPLKTEIPATDTNVQPETVQPAGPPSSWSKETKAIWDSLPASVKADAVKREAEVARGFDEYKSKTAQLTEIQQALAPVRHLLQQSGIQNEAQAVKRLLEWEGSFRNPQTRVQAFHALAQQYGFDLSQVAQGSDHTGTGQDIPPQIRPIIDQFGNVVQQVNSVQAEIHSLRTERATQDIAAFANGKPHFEKVRTTMAQLMSGGLAQTLDEAYQKAVDMDPEIRSQTLNEALAKQKTELEKSRLAQADKARQAAISPGPRARQVAPVKSNGEAKGVRGSILAAIRAVNEDQRA